MAMRWDRDRARWCGERRVTRELIWQKAVLRFEADESMSGCEKMVLSSDGAGPKGCCKRSSAWVDVFHWDLLMAGRRVNEWRERNSGPQAADASEREEMDMTGEANEVIRHTPQLAAQGGKRRCEANGEAHKQFWGTQQQRSDIPKQKRMSS